MTIRFLCPDCQRTIKARPTQAGRQFRCPNPECRAVITVPNADGATDGAGPGVSLRDAVSQDSGSSRTPGGSPVADGVPADWKSGDVILDLYEVKTFDAEGRVDYRQGGFGRVHRVHHCGWNVDLAVKSPRPGLFANKRDQKNFVGECETWINLGLHPHIVSCHYVRVLGGIPRVFAEFVEGGNLKDWIDEGRFLPSPEPGRGVGGEGAPADLQLVLDTAIQIAWGMAFAHSKGLVHRDLKPANVLMTAQGTAKVTDFGLARDGVVSGEAAEGPLAGAVFVSTGAGTPGYAAPEQVSAGRRVDGRADIFAFGVTLWSMLGGRLSWIEGVPREQLLRKSVVAHYAVTRLLKQGEPASLPPSLAELILRCLEPESDDRWPDFGAIVATLQQIYVETTGGPYTRPAPRPADALADVLNNRALTMLDLGKTDEAVRTWQQALAADAMHLDSVYNYGLYQWRAAEIDDVTLVGRVRQAGLGTEPWRAAVLAAQVELERDDCQAAIEVLEAVPEADAQRKEIAALLAVARSLEPSSRRCVRTFTGHTGDVLAVCLSSDERHALSGSADTTSKWWGLATGKCLRTLEGHSRPVLGVALTPDGQHALSASADKTLKQWELNNGRCSRTFEADKAEYGWYSAAVNSVCLSPDGRRALSSSDDKTLRLWEVDTGQCLKIFKGHANRVADACLSSDGGHAFSGSSDRTLRLWDVNDGNCLRTFDGHNGLVFSVCLSSDGRHALSGSSDTTLKLWEVESGRCVSTFQSHTGDVNGVCLSPDGRYALSASSDQTLKLWEVASGRCLRTFADHRDVVHAVSWNSRGRYALSGGADQTVKLWESSGNPDRPAPWEVSQPVEGGASSEAAAQFADAIAAGRRNLQRGDAASAARSVRQARAIRGYQRHTEAVSCWSDLYRRLPKVALADGWPERTLQEHAGGVNAVCLDSDGRTALSASSDGTLKLWELESGRCVRTFEGHAGEVLSIAWSLAGRYALSGGMDRMLRLWEVSSGKCLRTFEGHAGAVTSGVLSSDSRYALSGSADQTLRLWEIESGRCLRTYQGHTADVNSVCLSFDGRYALSGSSDTTLRLWEVATGECLRTFEGHTSLVSSVCLSVDGLRALSASWDGTLKLWDLAAGSCLQTFEGHTRAVNSVSISLDGRYALSGSSDGTAKLWDIGNGRCLRTFEGHSEIVHSVCFSLDGAYALSGSDDRTVRLYRLDWELGDRSPAGWDEAARPYLDAFLSQQTPYADQLPTNRALREAEVTLALSRRGTPTWTDQEFRQRLCGFLLGCGGFGWLQAEGVQRELERAASDWGGPRDLGSARVSDPAETPDRRSPAVPVENGLLFVGDLWADTAEQGVPAISETFGRGRGSVGRPATTEGGSVGRPATTDVGRPATASGRPATASGRPATAERLAEQIEFRGIKLRLIPAGRFLMGAPDSDKEASRVEKPQHLVRITRPFYLGVYPVTQAQYEAVLGSNPSHFKGDGNRPVEEVSWEEAMVFCRKLTEALRGEGGVGTFRLPTEAEWEYACRAGTNTRYCFGDNAARLERYAWFEENSRSTTQSVGQKKPNAWGLHDMHGNVYEWCQDWLGATYYAGCSTEDPRGPSGGSGRVARGGSWGSGASCCWASFRYRDGPGDRHNRLGFRLLRTVS